MVKVTIISIFGKLNDCFNFSAQVQGQTRMSA